MAVPALMPDFVCTVLVPEAAASTGAVPDDTIGRYVF